MHKGIKKFIRKFFSSREERNLLFTEMTPLLIKKDLKLKCGTLDGLKAHLCSLIMLLPGMPKNLLCKEELLPNLTIHGYLSYRLH